MVKTFKLYFLSVQNFGSLTPLLLPRIPEGTADDEDQVIPRICCSLTPYGCIHALELDFRLKDPNPDTIWYLFAADVPIANIVRPTPEQLPDHFHNDELWVTVPTRFTLEGMYNLCKQMNLGDGPYSRYSFTKINEESVVDRVGSAVIYGDMDSFSFIGFDMNKYIANKEKYSNWIV